MTDETPETPSQRSRQVLIAKGYRLEVTYSVQQGATYYRHRFERYRKENQIILLEIVEERPTGKEVVADLYFRVRPIDSESIADTIAVIP